MARKRTARLVLLIIVGALIVFGIGMAYRAFMAPWRGDVREPLIVSFFVGVIYFVSCMLWLRWSERRERANRRSPRD